MGIFDKLKKADDVAVDNEANEWLSEVDDHIERRTRVSVVGDIHEYGPTGEAATAALASLGLSDGATWAEVSEARQSFALTDADQATSEQRHAFTEANLAYASLRLLRAERRQSETV